MARGAASLLENVTLSCHLETADLFASVLGVNGAVGICWDRCCAGGGRGARGELCPPFFASHLSPSQEFAKKGTPNGGRMKNGIMPVALSDEGVCVLNQELTDQDSST